MDFIITELDNPTPKNLQQKQIPTKIFIVPYRNRIQHKFFFSKYMTFLLEDEEPESYEIYFSHQSDTRPFNRGATKNIGFLAMKKKYPLHYKNITFIFNDVDTLPFSKIFNYDTTIGTVEHLYGFNFALGGIVIFKGSDFEKINGYPNYWGWGMEDNVLQHRCIKKGLTIGKTQFYPIGSPEILQLFDSMKRIVTRKSSSLAKNDNGIDGVNTIYNLVFSIDYESTNPDDNINVVDNPNIFMINIHSFDTLNKIENNQFEVYDLREKRKPEPTNNIIGMNIISNSKNIAPQPSVDIYSKQYASNNNIKERSTKSVTIMMGGIVHR
jgi:hypothetical protein